MAKGVLTGPDDSAVSLINVSPHPHLDRAPIVEAVVEWRVRLPADADIETIRRLGTELPGYPHRQEETVWQLAAKIEKGNPSSISSRNLGVRVCRFTSDDKLRIAQVGLESCSFHQLRPYPRWIDVSKEALQLWAAYHGAMHPVEVTRLAVRNINQVLLPAGSGVEQFFRVAPTLPPGLETARVENSLLRYTVSRPNKGETLGANVIMTVGQIPDGSRQVTLDVDAYFAEPCSPEDPSIETRLEELHVFKNDVFFSFLTEEAIKKFK